jgi:RNA 2',3'-cyclic 3'-phosphodiesterase
MARLFVAVPVPQEIREYVYFQALQLGMINGLKLSNPENYHLTLAFLGEADSSAVERSLFDTPTTGTSLKITAEGWGAFPTPLVAKVLWAGIHADGLQALSKRIKMVLSESAPNMDRSPFKPHLTIGRLRDPQPLTLERVYAPRTWSVDHYELLESKLGGNGATYSTVAQFQI